jgi:hypothetical protein
MKNILTNLMTTVGLLCTLGGGLNAQSYRLSATVPFGWQANSQHLGAGTYQVTKEQNAPMISVRNTTDGKVTYVITSASSGTNSRPRLVFHRIGDQYFLAEVWAPGSTGATLVMSSAEKESMASVKGREVATVLVDLLPAFN